MKDVFAPNSDPMEELCELLNKSNCKGWQPLAVLWGVDPNVYFYFIPDTKASASKILLEWLMIVRPEFTVFKFCEILSDLRRNTALNLLAERLLAN